MLLRFPTASSRAAQSLRPQNDDLLSLVRETRAGNAEAGGTLVAVLTPYVFRQVRRILGATHIELDDVAQDAILEVVRALPRYREECTVLHFASRVAVKVAIDVRRRDRYRDRRGTELEHEVKLELEAHQISPEQHVATRSLVEAVRELLATLPEAQAEAVALHFVIGLSVTEIAAATLASFETTRSRLRLGMNALRELVSGDERWQDALGRSGA